jgi:hypothetical protein
MASKQNLAGPRLAPMTGLTTVRRNGSAARAIIFA